MCQRSKWQFFTQTPDRLMAIRLWGTNDSNAMDCIVPRNAVYPHGMRKLMKAAGLMCPQRELFSRTVTVAIAPIVGFSVSRADPGELGDAVSCCSGSNLIFNGYRYDFSVRTISGVVSHVF